MKTEIEHCIQLYKEKRYEIISERMIQVDSYIVTEQVKKGRVIITCSCQNHSIFPNESLCRHKRFFIVYPFINLFLENLNKKISLFESLKYSKDMNKSFEIAIKELKELKELRFK